MDSLPNSAPPLPDLGGCDREPIHIPGSIQPYGCPLALSGERFRIVRASLSSALIRDGAPWGLIACHHRAPVQPDPGH